MKSKKTIWIIIAVIVCVAILAVIVEMIFSNYDLNEGKFRVSDAIVTSTAFFQDKSKINEEWSYDISQLNNLVMLISAPEDTKITRTYISSFSTSNQNVVLSEEGFETKLTSGILKTLDIDAKIDDTGSITLSLLIYNENILKDFNVNQYTKSLKKDGTVFALAGMKKEDVKFEVSFDINIVEKTGRKSVLNIKLNLPQDKFFEEGTEVYRLDNSKLNFKI